MKCCNTCDEIKTQYVKKSWNIMNVLKDEEKCIRDKNNPFAHVKTGEGCRVAGTMKVNKVSGNFHIAHGESIIKDGHHIHQYNVLEAPKYNISHTLHSISFGDPYPEMPPNPLDGEVKIVDAIIGTGLFQYFLKVVPTRYKENNLDIDTNQYTVTERFNSLNSPNNNPNQVFY